MDNNLIADKPRIAAITGASKGIGLEIARTLAPFFDRMALVASSQDSFASVRDEFGQHVSFHGADFNSADEVTRLAEELRERHEHIDLLINNGGVYEEGPFNQMSLPSLERMLNVNTKAPLSLIRLLTEQLMRGQNSLVINMSSIQACCPTENLAAYAASKAALSAFSDALRKEFNPLGIRVTTIEPSGVNTWGETNPVGLLSPTDVAELVKTIVLQNPSVQVNQIVISGM